jgi:hypothetical protein
MLPSFRIWHDERDVSDILGFCGARGVTAVLLKRSNGLELRNVSRVANLNIQIIFFSNAQ